MHEAFGNLQHGNAAAHERKVALAAGPVMGADGAGSAVFRRIEIKHIGLEIAQQTGQPFLDFRPAASAHADEEVVAADMAEELVFPDKMMPEQRGKQADGQIALLEAVMIDRRASRRRG